MRRKIAYTLTVFLFICMFAIGEMSPEAKPVENAKVSQGKPSVDLTKTERGKWIKVFNRKNLSGWKAFTKTEYDKGGKVQVDREEIRMDMGFPYSAIQWDGNFPKENYKVSVRAKRTKGNDIFCGLLFPVGTNYCSMVMGGWANNVVGLSCVDNEVAVDNVTAVYKSFDNDKWYEAELSVTTNRIEAMIGTNKVIDLDLKEHSVSSYPGLDMLAPFAVFTYEAANAVDQIYYQRL